MKRSAVPFNIEFLVLSPDQKKIMDPVTSLDMFDGPGGQFHDAGLFSTKIFGKPGSALRDLAFGYIETRLPILHPIAYRNLCKIKDLYRAIMNEEVYAVWNPHIKDFEKADALTGDTGYHFFLSHLDEIEFTKTGSGTRDVRVSVLEKYRGRIKLDAVVVIPASLRELDVTPDGRTQMDDINTFYQRLIAIARTLPTRKISDEEHVLYDRARLQMQNVFCSIYDYIEGLLSGKKGFIQQRFASRRVFNATRGVLTSRDITQVDLGKHYNIGYMDAVVGIYQHSKALLPKTKYYLLNGLLKDVFETTSGNVRLVNRATLKSERVDIDGDVMDRWFSGNGMEAFVESMSTRERRHLPIVINDHYLALVYVDETTFKVFRSIDELPADKDPKNVHPITYVELLYISGYREWNKFRAITTRYPIAGMGSTPPVGCYVKTTVPGGRRYELDDQWESMGEEYMALEFPVFAEDINKTQYHDSISLPATMLAGLVGDLNKVCCSGDITVSVL